VQVCFSISWLIPLGLGNFAEPCFCVYRTESKALACAAEELQRILPDTFRDQDVIIRNTANCRDREEKFRKCYREAAEILLEVGMSQKTHWRYDIAALRMARALIQRDSPTDGPRVEYLLSKATNDHPSLRYVRLTSSLLLLSVELASSMLNVH
jgi:proteasome activator subunit 4